LDALLSYVFSAGVGYSNTLDEVDQTIDVLKKVVTELRSVSPYKTKYNF